MRYLVVLLFLLFVCGQVLAQGSPGSVPDAVLANVVSTNSLVGAGKAPFHLKVSFEINDLQGKPFEKGIAEEWWSASDAKVTLSAPSFGTVHGPDYSALPNDTARRSLDLASELLEAIRDPTSALRYRDKPAPVSKKKFGAVELTCAFPGSTQSGLMASSPMYCFTESLNAIRVVSGSGRAFARNSLAKYQGSIVAREVDLQYLDKVAITGHIDLLESFHQEAMASAAPPENPEKQDSPAAYLGPAVIAGYRIGGERPMYPGAARASRVSGTVVLGGEISPKGDIAFLFPVASSSDLLTGSAMDAVRTWKYTPYLINGKPVSVSTSITVNYNLNGPGD